MTHEWVKSAHKRSLRDWQKYAIIEKVDGSTRTAVGWETNHGQGSKSGGTNDESI